VLAKRDRSGQRRISLTGITGAAAGIFVAALPYWKPGTGAALFAVALLTAGAYAFAYAPYLNACPPGPVKPLGKKWSRSSGADRRCAIIG